MTRAPRAVRRIAASDALPALARLTAAREPVVLEGFLRDTGLHGVDTVDQARAMLGAVPLQLRHEFVAWSLEHGGAADQRPARDSSLSHYLDVLAQDPATPWMCTEFPTPDALLQALAPWPPALAGDGSFASFTFVGGAGHHAHLHFDGDFRNVLLVQVFGHKNAVLIPPSASRFLLPVGNFAGVFLDRLAGDERTAFLALTGAWTARLAPGDALLMPAAIWHYLEYPDTGMSINLRFGASAANTRLAGRFHAHGALQQLAWHFADAHVLPDAEQRGLEHLLAMAGPSMLAPERRALVIEEAVCALAETCTGPLRASAFAANTQALSEAARRHEAHRLYPVAAVADMALALHGWGAAPR